jgi:hypothetical protein
VADKRKGSWTIPAATRKEMRDCFKSDIALLKVIDSNSATWNKLEKGGLIKREAAREIVTNFLLFLKGVKANQITFDSGKHSKTDLDRAVEKYAGAKEWNWEDIAKDPTAEDKTPPPKPTK